MSANAKGAAESYERNKALLEYHGKDWSELERKQRQACERNQTIARGLIARILGGDQGEDKVCLAEDLDAWEGPRGCRSRCRRNSCGLGGGHVWAGFKLFYVWPQTKRRRRADTWRRRQSGSGSCTAAAAVCQGQKSASGSAETSLASTQSPCVCVCVFPPDVPHMLWSTTMFALPPLGFTFAGSQLGGAGGGRSGGRPLGLHVGVCLAGWRTGGRLGGGLACGMLSNHKPNRSSPWTTLSLRRHVVVTIRQAWLLSAHAHG